MDQYNRRRAILAAADAEALKLLREPRAAACSMERIRKGVRDPNTPDLFGIEPTQIPPHPRVAQSNPESEAGRASKRPPASPLPATRANTKPVSDTEIEREIERRTAAMEAEKKFVRQLRRSRAGKIAGIASGKARQKNDEAELLAQWAALGGGRWAASALAAKTGIPTSTLYYKLKRAKNEGPNRSLEFGG